MYVAPDLVVDEIGAGMPPEHVKPLELQMWKWRGALHLKRYAN